MTTNSLDWCHSLSLQLLQINDNRKFGLRLAESFDPLCAAVPTLAPVYASYSTTISVGKLYWEQLSWAGISRVSHTLQISASVWQYNIFKWSRILSGSRRTKLRPFLACMSHDLRRCTSEGAKKIPPPCERSWYSDLYDSVKEASDPINN